MRKAWRKRRCWRWRLCCECFYATSPLYVLASERLRLGVGAGSGVRDAIVQGKEKKRLKLNFAMCCAAPGPPTDQPTAFICDLSWSSHLAEIIYRLQFFFIKTHFLVVMLIQWKGKSDFLSCPTWCKRAGGRGKKAPKTYLFYASVSEWELSRKNDHLFSLKFSHKNFSPLRNIFWLASLDVCVCVCGGKPSSLIRPI